MKKTYSLILLFCLVSVIELIAQVDYQKEILYLGEKASSPQEYILSKFKEKEIVLLAEDHAIKQHVDFVKGLIPALYEQGVYTLCMEFGATEMQGQLDSLLVADDYNPQLAREMMFFYNVGWAYQEYMDIYYEAWKLNKSLAANQKKFRIVNLSYQYDWSKFQSPRTPEVVAGIFYKGTPDAYRTNILEQEVISKGEKALVYMGLVHLFTRYQMPLLKVNNDDFCDYETGYLGNRLYAKYPDKITNIMFHGPMLSKSGHSPSFLSPADGQLEYLMYKNDYKPVGFDLCGSPLGQLPDHSYFSLCYNDFRMEDFFDGYLFLCPFRRMEGCTIDTLYFENQDWEQIKRQMPDPDWHVAKDIDEYWQQIKKYVDIKDRYKDLWQGGVPELTYGKIDRYKDFPTRFLKPRTVDVWLPEQYDKNKKYDVIYMHDGQMLFDGFTTWNQNSWEVDKTVGRLIEEKKIRDCIIVGIWSLSESRYQDYFPQKTISYLPPAFAEGFLKDYIKETFADNYLQFIVTELKPYIDAHYATNPGQDGTFIMGSSMGGLISLYALCEYPHVFGGAGCLSTHTPMILSWLGSYEDDETIPSAFRTYLAEHLPQANTKYIYMDYGDQTLDALYAPFQKQIDNLLEAKGWKKPYWETFFFPGTDHSEVSWAKRFSDPLLFLLGK